MSIASGDSGRFIPKFDSNHHKKHKFNKKDSNVNFEVIFENEGSEDYGDDNSINSPPKHYNNIQFPNNELINYESFGIQKQRVVDRSVDFKK